MPKQQIPRVQVFGAVLRDARLDAGLTVRELGRRSGIDPTYISRLERGLLGPPTWSMMVAIARHLPSSPLAKALQGSRMIKSVVLQSASQALDLLLGLPETDFGDREWCAAVREILDSCIAIIGKRAAG